MQGRFCALPAALAAGEMNGQLRQWPFNDITWTVAQGVPGFSRADVADLAHEEWARWASAGTSRVQPSRKTVMRDRWIMVSTAGHHSSVIVYTTLPVYVPAS